MFNLVKKMSMIEWLDKDNKNIRYYFLFLEVLN